MSIRVTCTKCHARFNVSEKFAGKEGPCPKCKAMIRVPLPTEEVRIEAPKPKGPTDTQGKAIVDPIMRTDTVLTGLHIAMIAAGIIGFLVVSLVLRFMITDWNNIVAWVLVGIGAVAIAIPIIFVAYAIFRDQEREGFLGGDLWKRIGVCALVYAVSWLALLLGDYAFPRSDLSSVLSVVVMFAAGTVAAVACFEFEWLMASAHYGLYFGVALLGRVLAGLPALSLKTDELVPGNARPTAMVEPLLDRLPQFVETLGSIYL